MFSGGEMPGPDGERNYPTQWALNPSAYQNVANDQVDWAALAQQWIMMKETCPPEQVPPAPPPPPIGPVKKELPAVTPALIEGGEAPMEVENDKDDPEETPSAPDAAAPPASWTGPGNLNAFMADNTSGPGSWNWQQQQQWGWNAGWNPPSGVSGPSTPAVLPATTVGKTPLLPTPYPFPATESATAPGFSGSRTNNYTTGYWTGNQHSRVRGNKQKTRVESDDEAESGAITLDAAKRRQLPAWIREGLEKMEREKQKQLDKEREAREREEFLRRKKEEEEEVRKVMTNSGIVVLPNKSKFDSDSDESETEAEIPPPAPQKTEDRTPPVKLVPKKKDTPEPNSPVRSKSREDRMQDVMLTVRRMMTEILLDVTTDEIENICQEELKRYRASASAMNLQKTPALASLTGKLGLGIYGDSGSSGSESENTDREDSDTDLKEAIRRRKADFARTEREIEARVLDAEWRQAEHERVQRERDERATSVNARDGERYTQVDTANPHHGHLEKITPRKSRFHDGSVTDPVTTRVPPEYSNSVHTEAHKTEIKNDVNYKRRNRDKSSSSRSRSSSSDNSDNSQSKSDTSSESDSSNSREKLRSRGKRSVSTDKRGDHYEKRRDSSSEREKRRKLDSDVRTHDRDSSAGSVEQRRSGKVFKNPRHVGRSSNHKDEKDTGKCKNGDAADTKSRKSIWKHQSKSPEYRQQRKNRGESSRSSRYSKSPSRSRRSRSIEQTARYGSRSYKRTSRSRSRSRRRSRSRDRSRDKYSRRSPSREYHRDRYSERKHRSRSHDRRTRSRSWDRRRSRSRDYHRRSRSRSQHRGKKSHRH